MSWRRRCSRRRPPSIRITARRSACSPPAILSAPIWAGRTWRRWRRSPSAPRRRRSWPTARIRGRTTLWVAFICSRVASTIHWPSSRWRCGSIRISRWPRATTAWRWPIAGAGRRPLPPRNAPCGLSPRDPLAAVYCGIASYAQFVGRNYDEAMRLAREGIRQRGDFVGAHRVLTAAAGMAGQIDVAKAALLELRRAQPNISLDWIAKADADPARRRARALSGRLPPRRLGIDFDAI